MDSKDVSGNEAPRSRLEDEVLEILQRSDREPNNVVRFSDAVRRRHHGFNQRAGATQFDLVLTGANLLIASLALAVLAYFLKDASPLLARLIAILSLAAIVGLFVRSYTGPESPRNKTWRGRDIDLSSPSGPDWFNRRFRGPKGPRR